MDLTRLKDEWFGNVRADVLAGIVVALALIPEAIAFSIIAGVDPKVALYASFSIAVLIAFTGGRPAMISAATAATAVLMVTLVRDHGLQYLLAATVLAGVLQILAGVAGLARLMRFVSRSVMTGFVNALAILIFMAQLPELTGVPPLTYVMVAAGLAIIYLVPLVFRAVPSPLICIIVLTIVTMALHLDLRTVGDLGALPDSLPVFLIPRHPARSRDAADHPALFHRRRRRGAARNPDDRPDRRRTHRHPLRQEPRMRRPGHRQRRHRLSRRHGRLRDDRPVDDQREVRRPRPALDLHRRRGPPVHAASSSATG